MFLCFILQVWQKNAFILQWCLFLFSENFFFSDSRIASIFPHSPSNDRSRMVIHLKCFFLIFVHFQNNYPKMKKWKLPKVLQITWKFCSSFKWTKQYNIRKKQSREWLILNVIMRFETLETVNPRSYSFIKTSVQSKKPIFPCATKIFLKSTT